jgi:hypothetical protein
MSPARFGEAIDILDYLPRSALSSLEAGETVYIILRQPVIFTWWSAAGFGFHASFRIMARSSWTFTAAMKSSANQRYSTTAIVPMWR